MAALLLGGASVACSSAAPRDPVARAAASEHRAPPTPAQPAARWVARPDAPFVHLVGASATASWLLMAGTQRLELKANGELRVAEQWLAHSDYSVAELAPRLGGGFLFTRRGDNTVIERASTYLADLQPVARLDVRSAEVVQGLDRLYVVLERTRGIVALDPQGKGAVTLGPLPDAPAYGPIAFADPWFGLVTVPFQGALVTYDAGASWQPLGVSGIRRARVADAGIEITHGAGTSLVHPDGTIADTPREASLAEPTAPDESSGQGGGGNEGQESNQEVAKPLGGDMRTLLSRQIGERLVNTALRGWPLDEYQALLLEGGTLFLVSLETARAVESHPHLTPENANCHATPLFAGVGFICHTPRESLLYEASASPLDARLVRRFPGPRVIAAAGTGGAVVSGPCGAAPLPRDSRTWCIVPRTGKPWPISLERYDDSARVVALGTGDAAIMTPPARERRGSLSIATPNGMIKHSLPLRLAPGSPRESSMVLERARWLWGTSEHEDGSLSNWLADGESLIGVVVRQDGTVEVGQSRGTVAGALFTSRSALVLGSEGEAWQTTDGGQAWRSVPAPRWGEAAQGSSDYQLRPRGCGLVGCVVQGWVRLGWKESKSTSDLPIALEVPSTPLPPAGGGRWTMNCSRLRRFQAQDGRATSDWPGFFGRPAPDRQRGEKGHSHSLRSGSMTLRGYAWGPVGSRWHPGGRWVVRALSGYDPPGDAWSSSVTVCPWADEPSTAEALGGERRSGPPLAWWTHFDPDGRGGLLRIGSVSEAETYLVEPDRPLLRVRGESGGSAFGLLGAVRTGGSWFALTALGAGAVAVSRIESGVAREVMRLRDDTGVSVPTLVRNREETALGLWVQDTKTRGAATRWFVYPIDPERGQAGDATVIDDDMLGGPPRPCTDDDSGWMLEGPLPLGPSLDLGDGDSRSSKPGSVRARLVVGERGLCVEGLMGVTSEQLVAALRVGSSTPRKSRFSSAIPLVLRDDDGDGDHWAFECLH